METSQLTKKYPSIKSILPRIHESYREIFIRQLRMLLSPEFQVVIPDTETLSIPEAFAALGKATYRVDMLQDIQKKLGEALGYSMIKVQTQELVDLHTNCQKQVETLNQYIQAYLYHQAKETSICPIP